jgi:uncharacterized protein
VRESESAEVVVVYVALPEIEIKAARQRYTCLRRSAEGGLYRYESLSSGFTTELPVDSNGLVADYPGVFRRVWSG